MDLAQIRIHIGFVNKKRKIPVSYGQSRRRCRLDRELGKWNHPRNVHIERVPQTVNATHTLRLTVLSYKRFCCGGDFEWN